jgi:hypothetical protein
MKAKAMKVMKVQKKPAQKAQGCHVAFGNAQPPREGCHRLPTSDVLAIHQVLPDTDLNQMVELEFDVKDIETIGFCHDAKGPHRRRSDGYIILVQVGSRREGSWSYSSAPREDEHQMRCFKKGARFTLPSLCYEVSPLS